MRILSEKGVKSKMDPIILHTKDVSGYYYSPELLYKIVGKMRHSSVYHWIKDGKCVVVQNFVCINSPKYIYTPKRGLHKLTQYAKDNIQECCIPNVPYQIINAAGFPDTDTTPSSEYHFKDLFTEKKIDKETLNLQAKLIGEIPKTFGEALKYIMEKLDYPSNILAYDAGIDPSVISKMRNNIDYKPNLRSIILVCITLKLSPVISYELAELAGYRLRGTVTKELGARYLLLNSGNLNSIEVKKLCDEYEI